MNHPTIYGNMNNISGINTTTNSSSIYFSPSFNQYIPFSPNSYMGQGYIMQQRPPMNQIKPIEFDSLRNVNILPRRLSENTYDNMKDTTLGSFSSRSNYMNYTAMNTSFVNQNNVSVRSLGKISYGGDDYGRYSGLVNNGYVSPRSEYHFKSSIIGNRTMGAIPTIHKKIMDWEKSNSEINDDIGIKDKEEPMITKQMVMSEQKKSVFISNYEGITNFLIFLRACTPYVLKRNFEQFVSYY